MKANEIVYYILLAAAISSLGSIVVFLAVDRGLQMLEARQRATKARRFQGEPGTEPAGDQYPTFAVAGDDLLPGVARADRKTRRRFNAICRQLSDLRNIDADAMAACYLAPDDRWANLINPRGEG